MPKSLTTSQAAQLCHVNTSTIRRWCETGKIRAVKVGREWMIDGDSLIVKHQHPARKGDRKRVSLSCRVDQATMDGINSFYPASQGITVDKFYQESINPIPNVIEFLLDLTSEQKRLCEERDIDWLFLADQLDLLNKAVIKC